VPPERRHPVALAVRCGQVGRTPVLFTCSGSVTIRLLATDLDGTFLGGRQADRLALYRIFRRPDSPRLVFVTGRGVESVLPLLADPLIPDPEFIIADVGATVVVGDGLRPVTPLQWDIDHEWVGVDAVLAALGDVPGIVRQPVPQERRVSFYVETEAAVHRVRERMADLPVEVLWSAATYLDVLPRGASKGRTLARLVDQLGLPPSEVLVAGDTLNDLSLYHHGFRGVVVGGAEAGLVDATRGMRGVHLARAAGAGGVIEGLRTWSPAGAFVPAEPTSPSGDAQLVVAYHRLPFDERRDGEAVVRRAPTSPNGIIPTLLGCFDGGRPGSWVAWTTHATGGMAAVTHELVDEERYPNLVAAKLALTPADVDRFYKQFSKEAFWPVIFSFVDRAQFNHDDWNHFCGVNRRFAEAIAAEADQDALIWIHDYNLWMVPGYLRQIRPDLGIGFFHHTAFPPADVFNVIPWADQIVGSLAQCDHIGFHIPRYAANFVDVLRSHAPTDVLDVAPCAPRFRVHGMALAIPRVPRLVRSGDRELSLGVHPVGVNARAIEEVVADPEHQDDVARIATQFRDVQLVLSVERLDYVKGPLQKLAAFERLLERHPEQRGRVSLVFVTTPPAAGMEVYEEVRGAVDEAVGRINGRFGSLAWTPVHYFFRSLPFAEVLGYSAAADVAWITPLRDGLNLVAKEFVVAQAAVAGRGVLVLSEFAGAAVEMHGALLTNPYDIEQMCARLHEALCLPDTERRQRLERMASIVTGYDVDAWSRDFLAALERAAVGRQTPGVQG
jgi:glucosylglycerol-phosphate synthase